MQVGLNALLLSYQKLSLLDSCLIGKWEKYHDQIGGQSLSSNKGNLKF